MKKAVAAPVVPGLFERSPNMGLCPECEASVELDAWDVDKGEIISCPECGVDLEVVGLAPLELELAPREADEWGE